MFYLHRKHDDRQIRLESLRVIHGMANYCGIVGLLLETLQVCGSILDGNSINVGRNEGGWREDVLQRNEGSAAQIKRRVIPIIPN